MTMNGEHAIITRRLSDQTGRADFWRRVSVGLTSECWTWLGSKVSGYGRFQRWIDGKNASASAHRVAKILSGSPAPPGKHIDHLCHNTMCVNPDHLEWVTPTENQHRSHLGKPERMCKRKLHEMDDGHIYVFPNGTRTCRPCRDATMRRYYERHRDATSV